MRAAGNTDTQPLSDNELTPLFQTLDNSRGVALAVSGGSDSMALLHTFDLWCRQRQKVPPVHVLTVDHGLRPQAKEETALVVEAARARGFAPYVLSWPGAKVQTGIQNRARQARYRLMFVHMKAHGLEDLVTAHNREDQAETFLMRLMRGSSVSGLAAMAPKRKISGIIVHRPFLSVAKMRLVATLQRDGIAWLEDASNQDPRYERVRARNALAELDKAQLGDLSAAQALARSAGRLAHVDGAIKHAARCHQQASAPIQQGGYVRTPAERFLHADEAVVIASLETLLPGIGGRATPPRLARLERLFAQLKAGRRENRPVKQTLSGCVISLVDQDMIIAREAGRVGLERLSLGAGRAVHWDRRFRVTTAADLPDGITLAALGVSGRRQVRDALPAQVPFQALDTLPAAWHEEKLLAVYPFGPVFHQVGAQIKVVQTISTTFATENGL